MEGLVVIVTVADMLGLADEITERILLRLVADATEYAVIGLAVRATALKLAADALQ